MRRVSLLDRRQEFDTTMTPMIDVVFLLLIFFVWTASFQIVEQSLPGSIALPPAGKGDGEPPAVTPQDDFDPIVVRIGMDHGRATWSLQAKQIEDAAALRRRLAEIARIRRAAPVIIHPDSDVPLGYVVDAYDAVRSAGFDTIQFATPQEPGRS